MKHAENMIAARRPKSSSLAGSDSKRALKKSQLPTHLARTGTYKMDAENQGAAFTIAKIQATSPCGPHRVGSVGSFVGR